MRTRSTLWSWRAPSCDAEIIIVTKPPPHLYGAKLFPFDTLDTRQTLSSNLVSINQNLECAGLLQDVIVGLASTPYAVLARAVDLMRARCGRQSAIPVRNGTRVQVGAGVRKGKGLRRLTHAAGHALKTGPVAKVLQMKCPALLQARAQPNCRLGLCCTACLRGRSYFGTLVKP